MQSLACTCSIALLCVSESWFLHHCAWSCVGSTYSIQSNPIHTRYQSRCTVCRIAANVTLSKALEQEAQLPQRNSASAGHMEERLSPPAHSLSRSFWLHLCIWSNPKNRKVHREKLKQNRRVWLPKQKCSKFSTETRKCVTWNNVSWQTVPQPSTGSSKRSVSNSCTLRLADVQLMGQWWPQSRRRRLDGVYSYLRETARQLPKWREG